MTFSIADFADEVSNYYGFKKADLTGKKRTQGIVRARHVCMVLIREFTHASQSEIGEFFGYRDHTTVWHAEQSFKNQMDTDDKFRNQVLLLRGRIREKLYPPDQVLRHIPVRQSA